MINRAESNGGPLKMGDNMRVVIVLALLALGACSRTLPVSGSMEDGSETFTGTSTANGDRTGTMTVQSNKGLSCQGDWSYISEHFGRGVMSCNNGQSGPFEFNGVGPHGSGTGRLGDRRFVFRYG
jgi:hypothetical protein